MEETLTTIVGVLEDIKKKITDSQYKLFYDALTEIVKRDKPTYKHQIYFVLKSTITLVMEDGDEVEKEIETSFDEVVYLKNRIDYTFDLENEIEYVLIKNGVNPFRLISNKHFNKHIDNVFKKYRSIILKGTTEITDLDNTSFDVNIIRVNPVE